MLRISSYSSANYGLGVYSAEMQNEVRALNGKVRKCIFFLILGGTAIYSSLVYTTWDFLYAVKSRRVIENDKNVGGIER